MSKKAVFSVIIPAYKEEKRLPKNIGDFISFSKDYKYPVELIFVDDGSPDGTSEVIKKSLKGLKNARLIRLPENQGKGAAICAGMKVASGEFLLFADADNSTPIWQAKKFFDVVDKKTVLIGSRYVAGAHLQKRQPLFRVLGSRILNLFVQAILLPGVKDTQCGFKLFPKAVVEEMLPKLRFRGFSFDLEALAVSKHLGYRIKEVPVVWRDNPRSTVRPIRDGIKFVADTIRIKLFLIGGRYD
jgi:dolichyl-phosphate beta-glucosyltransferase